MAKFTEILEDVTKKGVKIPSNLYLDTGLYPIIDQGQSAIAGYTNKADGLFFDVPAIIFGDHTRIFKYVEKPCFLGADGVKLLKAKKPNANHKYLYYALCNADIPNTGYNRHFKWLKEVDIPEYSEEEQEDIVLKLDKISHLIALRKRQLSKLDELVKSRFVEMFGEPIKNPMNWPKAPLGTKCTITTGNTPPRANPKNYGKFIEWIKSDNIVDGRLTNAVEYLSEEGFVRSRHVESGAILMTCIAGSLNSIGNCAMVNRRVAFNQQLNAITPGEEYNGVFLLWLFRMAKNMLHKGINKCLKGILSKGNLSEKEFPLPPLALQQEFAAFVEKVDKLEFKAKASLEKLETLKKAMMQKYFN